MTRKYEKWKPKHDAQLRRLWLAGAQIKAICAEMKFCDTTIIMHCKALKLAPRWHRGGTKRGKCVSVYFDREMLSSIGRLSAKNDATPSEYIRSLVRLAITGANENG